MLGPIHVLVRSIGQNSQCSGWQSMECSYVGCFPAAMMDRHDGNANGVKASGVVGVNVKGRLIG